MADGGEDALNRIGRAQVIPVLGGEVEERQQSLGVLGQAGDGGCIFGPVFFREDREDRKGLRLRFGMVDVLQVRRDRRGHGLWKLAPNIRTFVEPAPLMAGARKHFIDRLPEPKSAVRCPAGDCKTITERGRQPLQGQWPTLGP